MGNNMPVNNLDEAREMARNMFEESLMNKENAANNEGQGFPPPPEDVQTEESAPLESEIGTVTGENNEAVPITPSNDGQTMQEAAQNNNITQNDPALQAQQYAQQLAAQQQAMMQQLMQENEQLKQANDELQKTITQQSDVNEAAVEQRSMPMMDFNSLAFDDEETIAKKQSAYAQEMADYVTQGVMAKLAPFIGEANEGIKQKEREKVLEELESMPEFSDIRSFAQQMDSIMTNNPALFSDDVDMMDKYIAAYAMTQGAKRIKNPIVKTEPTTEELMNYYNSNPEFKQMVEQQRIGEIKKSQQVPAMSATGGAANAALNMNKSPETMDEASERAKAFFMGR